MTYDDYMARTATLLGKEAFSTMDENRITLFLNEALKDIYDPPHRNVWTWATVITTVTLADYQMDFTDIDSPKVWTVWSEDPVARFGAANAISNYALRSVPSAGMLTVQAGSATAEVVIFSRALAPVFVVGDTNADPIPDEVVPWLSAAVWRELMEKGMAPQSEASLAKALQRMEEEYQKLISNDDAVWRNAPWLTLDAFESYLTRR